MDIVEDIMIMNKKYRQIIISVLIGILAFAIIARFLGLNKISFLCDEQLFLLRMLIGC